MAKRLTAAFVRNVRPPAGLLPAKHYDEHGLHLRVMPSGSKQWVQRLMIRGRRRDIGLGGYPVVTLSEARAAALENRRAARAGGDPLAAKRAAKAPTFADALESTIALHSEAWRDGGKTAKQWRASMKTYALPRLGALAVDAITAVDVLAVLAPIWSAKRPTAAKLRQRIGAVLKWAIAQGYRADNPAGDALAAALPRNGGGGKHYRALPHGEVAGALATIRASGAGETTKLALRFLTLTACRSGEARGAAWAEIDLAAALWTVPASRTKTGREHRVPLSGEALAVLAEAATLADGDGLVFPSPRGRPLSDNTLSKALRDNGIDAVPHGFRSSFRDWAGETGQPREVAEACLAHAVGGAVEQAYARSDLLARRRVLMDAWGRYLSGAPADVIRLDRRTSA